jgi:hypothetical protein
VELELHGVPFRCVGRCRDHGGESRVSPRFPRREVAAGVDGS